MQVATRIACGVGVGVGVPHCMEELAHALKIVVAIDQ